MKLKILIILLCFCLVSATTYLYISSNQSDNDEKKSDNDEKKTDNDEKNIFDNDFKPYGCTFHDTFRTTSNTAFIGRNFSALEGLNISNNYMESKYETFNLSKINFRGFQGPISNENGYNEYWDYRYVIDDHRKVTFEYVKIYNNGTITSSISTFEKEKLLVYHTVPDMHGFDVGLVKIDSDEVMDLINRKVRSESWYDDYIQAEEKSFNLYLKGFRRDGTSNVSPMWAGWYEIENGADDGIGDFLYVITVNAVTGEGMNRKL